jgi:hypothetical protein
MTMRANRLSLRIAIVGSWMIIGAVALLANTPRTAATNINSHGAVCQPLTSGDAVDLRYTNPGIKNGGTVNRLVLCPIPRSPLASGATQGSFFIDGDNDNGGSTTCSLVTFDFSSQNLLGASTFTVSGTYDKFVSLPAAQLPTFAYAGLFCTLPPGAQLRGVTSVQ